MREEQAQVDAYGYDYDLSAAVEDTGASRYAEGMLVIDFVNAATNSAVWRGTRKSCINDSSDRNERGAKIEAAVEDIIGSFHRVSSPA